MFNLIKLLMNTDWSSYDVVNDFDHMRDWEQRGLGALVAVAIFLIVLIGSHSAIFAIIAGLIAYFANGSLSDAVSKQAFNNCRDYQNERLGI